MIKITDSSVIILNGREIIAQGDDFSTVIMNKQGVSFDEDMARKGTISYSILSKHNHSDSAENLKLKFDSLTAHDITYVGIIQTAMASGMIKFPVPYVLTNCHNSLCAVGG